MVTLVLELYRSRTYKTRSILYNRLPYTFKLKPLVTYVNNCVQAASYQLPKAGSKKQTPPYIAEGEGGRLTWCAHCAMRDVFRHVTCAQPFNFPITLAETVNGLHVQQNSLEIPNFDVFMVCNAMCMVLTVHACIFSV